MSTFALLPLLVANLLTGLFALPQVPVSLLIGDIRLGVVLAEDKQCLGFITQVAGRDQKISELELLHAPKASRPCQLKLKALVRHRLELQAKHPRTEGFALAGWQQKLKDSKNITKVDLLVYGDELPAIAAAVGAARQSAKLRVLLVRPQAESEALGGLLTRGGLAYLDRNQEDSALSPSSAFYGEFLERAGVQKIALKPAQANAALRALLREAGVIVFSGRSYKPVFDAERILGLESVSGQKSYLLAEQYIDATQNASLAQQTDLAFTNGFEGVGLPKATLRVTPVFTTVGLTPADLLILESKLAQTSFKSLQEKLRTENDPATFAWYQEKLAKKAFQGIDYIDFRSPLLALAYQESREQRYSLRERFLMDIPNIAVLGSDRLSWNCFLYKLSPSERALNPLTGALIPTSLMKEEIKSFGAWLSAQTGKKIKIIPAQELYERSGQNLIDAKEIFQDEVKPKQVLGSFTYGLDVRGGLEGYSGVLPQKKFEYGLAHTLSRIENLAVLGRSSAYFGLTTTLGRIVELNSSIGSDLGQVIGQSCLKKVPPQKVLEEKF